MHRMLALILSVCLVSTGTAVAKPQAPPPTQAPTEVGKLTPETTVRLVLKDRLKSGTSHEHDRITFQVADDVVDPGGTILVKKDTPAYGTVVRSRGAKSFGRAGKLDITIDYTTAVDGQQVRLRGNKGGSGSGKSGVAAAVSVFVFLPAGFFINGKNIELEPETLITAYVDQPITVRALAETAPAVAAKPSPERIPAGGPEQRKLLVLRNGDRITGKITGLANGLYTVSTSNGVLKISEAEVAEIKDATGGETR